MMRQRKKPEWLKVRLGHGARFVRTATLVKDLNLHTVCQSAQCPNQGACWEQGRATVMILGEVCTRACRFCAVRSEVPGPPDSGEPLRVAEAAARMGLSDIVITSVTRDDLPDGGAGLWAETIRCVRQRMPEIVVETLIPDFGGSEVALEQVAVADPAVFGHNMETVPGFYTRIRPGADYARSLRILNWGHRRGLVVKTGVMAGLGESFDEMEALIGAIADTGCDILYIGQYLQPSPAHWPVARYVEPIEFDRYRELGRQRGIPVVVSAPLVRSSYHTVEQSAYVNGRQAGWNAAK